MNLVQALPEAIYLVDQGGRILFCNPALERLSGYAAETLRHRPDLILYLPEVAAALEKWRRRVRRGEEIPPLAEVQLVRKDGTQCRARSKRTHQLSGSPAGAQRWKAAAGDRRHGCNPR